VCACADMGSAQDAALLAAAHSGNVAAARAALDAGANVECTDKEVRARAWPLLRVRAAAVAAARRPCTRAPCSSARGAGTRRLPTRGADACTSFRSHARQYAQTPLSCAAGRGHLGVAQLLLERRAHIEAIDKARSRCSERARPRARAGRSAPPKRVPRRAAADRVVRCPQPRTEWGAPHRASHAASRATSQPCRAAARRARARARSRALGGLLLRHCAAVARAPFTPIYFALPPHRCRRRHCLRPHIRALTLPPMSAAVLRCVVRAQDGWTPLHHAARFGHASVVTLLCEKGADTKAKSNVRSTCTRAPQRIASCACSEARRRTAAAAVAVASLLFSRVLRRCHRRRAAPRALFAWSVATRPTERRGRGGRGCAGTPVVPSQPRPRWGAHEVCVEGGRRTLRRARRAPHRVPAAP
jgi:hypothetical protein